MRKQPLARNGLTAGKGVSLEHGDMLMRMQAWFDATEMGKQAGKIKFQLYVPS